MSLLGGCPGPLVCSQAPVSVAPGPVPGLLGAGPLPTVTCAIACEGAWAAAAAGSSGGSASG